MSNKRPVVLVHRPTRASGVSMGEVGIPNGYQGANHYAVEACLIIFLHFVHAKYQDRKTVELRVISNASRAGFSPWVHPINSNWDWSTGSTTLSNEELKAIGNRLIDRQAEAGDYTKFWNNCQIWAMMFFHEIANDRQHWVIRLFPFNYRIMRLFM
ncbi:hypothetical protein OIDMADRAFT_56460 [Oidiodendron maius Zn]|uniref:Uncharacterized protein n=1 Tax=Oidiodendron maius (strain Zn) TaxID=913774 RepID=A0A0C3GTD9_OIDMZ|nr:hypothetical protein OIDMADRAFT_56460 [Oidiodendron maius Zn]